MNLEASSTALGSSTRGLLHARSLPLCIHSDAACCLQRACSELGTHGSLVLFILICSHVVLAYNGTCMLRSPGKESSSSCPRRCWRSW